MITIYFPDGSVKRVTPVQGQQLVLAGKASYTPYEAQNNPEPEPTIEPLTEEEPLNHVDPEGPEQPPEGWSTPEG